MSTLRTTANALVFSLATLALSAGAVGCSKDRDHGDMPASMAAQNLDEKEVTKTVGLSAQQEAKLVELQGERGEGSFEGKGHGRGGRGHGHRPMTQKMIDKRVAKLTEALNLSPQQAQKLRAMLEARAAKQQQQRA